MKEIKFDHMDADESMFFARQLEYTKKQTYDIKYADLKARKLIPVSTEVDPGAETIRWESYDQVGLAKIINSYAKDLPRADVKGSENISSVRSAGSSYGYSLQEVRAARMAGKPLVQRKADAAKRACLQLENTIAFQGSTLDGIAGLLNNANVPIVTLTADGTGSSALWANKSPAQVLRDLNQVSNFVMENTKTIEIPDTLLLPPKKFNYISTTPWSTTGNGESLLQLFLRQQSYIKNVDWVNELTGAGVGATDRMVVYRRDPNALTLEIPQDFEQLDVQPRGLEYVVPCHMRIAGVLIYYPLSLAYADGF